MGGTTGGVLFARVAQFGMAGGPYHGKKDQHQGDDLGRGLAARMAGACTMPMAGARGQIESGP
jgi:hypothetical protein